MDSCPDPGTDPFSDRTIRVWPDFGSEFVLPNSFRFCGFLPSPSKSASSPSSRFSTSALLHRLIACLEDCIFRRFLSSVEYGLHQASRTRSSLRRRPPVLPAAGKHIPLPLAEHNQVPLRTIVSQRNINNDGSICLQWTLALIICKEIFRRDLKVENTFLDGSLSPHIKICDFGDSKSGLLHSQPKSTVGTPAYEAREVLSRKEYDGKIADLCGESF